MKAILICLIILGLTAAQNLCATLEGNDGYGYYYTDGIDMAGGDVSSQEVASFEEAVADAKSYVNGHNTRVATLVPLERGRYRVYRKVAIKTAPPISGSQWINIFYGKKIATVSYDMT